MAQLHHEGSDLAGSHARALYETWLSSVYVLFGSQEALDRLIANDQHEQRRSARAFLDWMDANDREAQLTGLFEQSKAVLAEPEPRHGKLNVKDMATAVRRLTRREGEEDSDFYEKAYAFLYGPESYMSVHGGLDAMRRHIDGATNQIVSEGWCYTGEDQRLELAVAMVSGLANQLADRLALDRVALDEFAREWQRSL
jgi:hypothetical protein